MSDKEFNEFLTEDNGIEQESLSTDMEDFLKDDDKVEDKNDTINEVKIEEARKSLADMNLAELKELEKLLKQELEKKKKS